MPCEDLLNGGYQIKGKSRLCNVPESAGSQAGLDEISIGVNGQENNFCRAACVIQLLASLYPIENRHRDICDDHIGRKASRGVEQRLAVRHGPDNFAS